MNIIGCDLHTRYQQIARLERSTGEIVTRRPGVRPHAGAGGTLRQQSQAGELFGLNPLEHSSGGRQRLGAITKQGNRMLRWLLVEAGHTAARGDPELGRLYRRLKIRRASGTAKVAVARRLAVRLYWMLRQRIDYAQLVRLSGSPSSAVVPPTEGPKV